MKQLKHFFSAQRVQLIADDLHRVHKRLAKDRFIQSCITGLDDLELTARASHIASVMAEHLPTPFPKAADVIVRSLGPELNGTASNGMQPFHYLPHVLFVAKHGLKDFDAAMAAQYELTKRFTAEWSVRPYLVVHQARTLDQLRHWAKDENVHVRRLVSEGTRPRLPWAPRLRAFQKDPQPVLELLKDDSHRYVQRSVANNLNDIAKDHPNLAVATCERWLNDATPGRRWIVQHALRSLVKAGHRAALDALGFAGSPHVELHDIALSAGKVRLGEALHFSLALQSTAKRPQKLLVDYAVHFMKSSGETRPKVFKLKKLTLKPGERTALAGRISFAEMTTRSHHAGQHRIDLLVNGVAFDVAAFNVCAEGRTASRNRDALIQVHILNLIEQLYALIHRPLKGFAPRDQTHPPCPLVDHRRSHGLGEIAGAAGRAA